MGKKVDKEGSGWTAGGMEQQDDAAQPWLWSPVTGKGSTRPHAHPRAGMWTARCRRRCVTARAVLVVGGVATRV